MRKEKSDAVRNGKENNQHRMKKRKTKKKTVGNDSFVRTNCWCVYEVGDNVKWTFSAWVADPK